MGYYILILSKKKNRLKIEDHFVPKIQQSSGKSVPYF